MAGATAAVLIGCWVIVGGGNATGEIRFTPTGEMDSAMDLYIGDARGGHTDRITDRLRYQVDGDQIILTHPSSGQREKVRFSVSPNDVLKITFDGPQTVTYLRKPSDCPIPSVGRGVARSGKEKPRTAGMTTAALVGCWLIINPGADRREMQFRANGEVVSAMKDPFSAGWMNYPRLRYRVEGDDLVLSDPAQPSELPRYSSISVGPDGVVTVIDGGAVAFRLQRLQSCSFSAP